MPSYQVPMGQADDSRGVLRLEPEPRLSIPPDPANADWQEYAAWKAAGNAPLPAPPIDPAPRQRQAFAAAEDEERLGLINDRARTDPAFAALTEFVLRGREP